LIGNKVDLSDTNRRQVSTEEAKNYATEAGMLFFETSAYNATNVNYAFETMFDQVYKELSKNKLLKKRENNVNELSVGSTKTLTLRPPSATYEYNRRNKNKKHQEAEDGGGCC
jgi:GTPase SAR1 family protein